MADLVAAETEAQRRLALRQVEGGAEWDCVGLGGGGCGGVLAWQEALIDFPDEDLPATVQAELIDDVAGLAAEIKAAAQDGERGARGSAAALVVAIIGGAECRQILADQLSGAARLWR